MSCLSAMNFRIIFLSFMLSAIGSSAFAQHKTVVVSDYDDTFRITGYKFFPKVWNALFTDKIYAGADMLYAGFQGEYEALYFVSNSPEWLRKKITRRVQGYDLGPDSIFLYHGNGEKFDYKIASVKWILSSHPDCKVILLGDDATADHLVYDKIREEFPDRVLTIYIRPVRGRNLPDEIVRYYTEFEIANNEAGENRLKVETAKLVADEVMNAKKKYVLPRVIHLPDTMPMFTTKEYEELNKLQYEIFERLWKMK